MLKYIHLSTLSQSHFPMEKTHSLFVVNVAIINMQIQLHSPKKGT